MASSSPQAESPQAEEVRQWLELPAGPACAEPHRALVPVRLLAATANLGVSPVPWEPTRALLLRAFDWVADSYLGRFDPELNPHYSAASYVPPPATAPQRRAQPGSPVGKRPVPPEGSPSKAGASPSSSPGRNASPSSGSGPESEKSSASSSSAASGSAASEVPEAAPVADEVSPGSPGAGAPVSAVSASGSGLAPAAVEVDPLTALKLQEESEDAPVSSAAPVEVKPTPPKQPQPPASGSPTSSPSSASASNVKPRPPPPQQRPVPPSSSSPSTASSNRPPFPPAPLNPLADLGIPELPRRAVEPLLWRKPRDDRRELEGESYEVRRARARASLAALPNPPFSLQRLAEVLLQQWPASARLRALLPAPLASRIPASERQQHPSAERFLQACAKNLQGVSGRTYDVPLRSTSLLGSLEAEQWKESDLNANLGDAFWRHGAGLGGLGEASTALRSGDGVVDIGLVPGVSCLHPSLFGRALNSNSSGSGSGSDTGSEDGLSPMNNSASSSAASSTGSSGSVEALASPGRRNSAFLGSHPEELGAKRQRLLDGRRASLGSASSPEASPSLAALQQYADEEEELMEQELCSAVGDRPDAHEIVDVGVQPGDVLPEDPEEEEDADMRLPEDLEQQMQDDPAEPEE